MNDEKEDPQAQSWQKTILKKIGSKLLECMNPAAASHFAQRGDKMVLRRQVFLTFLGHCHCHCDAAAAAAVNPVCSKCDLQIGTLLLPPAMPVCILISVRETCLASSPCRPSRLGPSSRWWQGWGWWQWRWFVGGDDKLGICRWKPCGGVEELDVEKADAELWQLGKLAGEQVRMRTKMKTIMTMTMENKRMRIKIRKERNSGEKGGWWWIWGWPTGSSSRGGWWRGLMMADPSEDFLCDKVNAAMLRP